MKILVATLAAFLFGGALVSTQAEARRWGNGYNHCPYGNYHHHSYYGGDYHHGYWYR